MKKITLFLAALVIAAVTMAAPIMGTFKVGTTEVAPNFTSLSAAVAALNSSFVIGDVVLEITSDITEPANVGLGVNTNGWGITIRPDIVSDPNTDPMRTITFTKTTDNTSAPSGHFVIGYSALTVAWADANTISTNKVTIDGYAVGGTTRRLKFTTASASITASKLTVIVGACVNTIIKNCIYESKSTGTSAQCIGMVSRKLIGTGEACPINVTIDNNIITSVASASGQGINTTNSGTLVNGKTTGLVVKNNIITAQGRCGWFYYINGGDFFGNELHLTQLGSSATTNYGLWTSTGASGTFNIYNNKFLEVTTMETAAGGMRALSLGSGAVYNVYNNYFAGMDRKAVAVTGSVPQTYVFFGGTSGYINNNTFYMPPLTAKTTPGYYQAITLSSSNPVIKNNIFISNEDGMVNAFFGAVSTGSIDYNVFYNKAGNTKSLFVSGTATSTFAAYQTANPTKDKNSKNVDVNFVSATDLTLTGASIGDYNLAVPRISTILTDIAGTNRPNVTYAGAFEGSDLTSVAKQFTVTVPNGTAHVYIAGDFTGKAWDNTTPFELVPTGTANQFSGVYPCIDGLAYKYLCEKTGDWDYAEAVYDGGNAPLVAPNRTFNATDNVPIWYRVNKITFNASFAAGTLVPSQLFVKGSWDVWATGIAMTKTANTFSTTLGGNVGDKFPANTEYKYYTNDMVTDNWESDATGGNISNRWAIAPIMNDVVARFTTLIITKVNDVETSARIMRTASGIEVVVESESTIELYGINGVLIDRTNVSGSYSHDLNNGIYIVRVNGKATKFVK